jgi:colanic acid/amylovoran biosynthesis glycosyltransferase
MTLPAGRPAQAPVALHRIDRFVARTMNWAYDHLRHLPRYRPVVMANVLENRAEFPDVDAFAVPWKRLGSRVWRRLAGGRPYPPDVWRIRRLRPVVLQAHFGYFGVESLPLRRALGVPLVVAFHGADVYLHGRDPVWRERYARLFDEVALVLALGPVMRQALVALGCPADRIVIQPLGADPGQVPHAVREPPPGGPLEVLFAGTFREKKGLVYLVEAAALLAARGVPFRLHVVGEPGGRPEDQDTRREVEAALARAGLGDRLVRYPFLEFRRLMELALRCHVFAAPSVTAQDGDSEGVPVVVQQMMLSGMPVVSTRHSDIPFLYGPLAGRLVPERDAAALADRLAEYADRPDLVAGDGGAMRRRILEAFDVRDCAARLAGHYDALLAGPGTDRASGPG